MFFLEDNRPLTRPVQSWKTLMRTACAFLLWMLCGAIANGQANMSGYNELAKQRLLIRITAQYLHTINQGQIDMDSAISIPCSVYHLNPFIAYNEVYNDGQLSTASGLLNAGRLSEARNLLAKSSGEERLSTLIELGIYFVFKPGNAASDLNEATKYISQALNMTKTANLKWKVTSLGLQGELLLQLGRQGESRKIFKEMVNLSEQSTNKRMLGLALLTAGGALYYGDPERLADFKKALEIFEALNDKEKSIEAISQMIIEHFVAKRYDEAERLLLEIIRREGEINFYCRQYPYDALAYITNRKGQLTNALDYSNKCLDAIPPGIDSVFKGYFYLRRGTIFERMQKNQEAMFWFDKALTSDKNQLRIFWLRPLAGKVNMLLSLGQPDQALSHLKKFPAKFPISSYFEQMHYAYLLGRTYYQLKNFRLAETNYQQFLSMAKVFPLEYVHDEFPLAYQQISTFYLQRGKTGRAKELLEKARAFTTNEDLQSIGLYYYYLFKIDSAEKKYLQAILHLQKGHAYIDSAFSIDQSKKADELLVKYETEKKDKNIKLLNSQKQVAQVKADEATRTKNITLAGLILLIIIILLLIRLYVNKQKANRKLEANRKELDQKNTFLEKVNNDKDKLLKEKEWLLKEVHHRVKNNLQMVTSLLYSQSVYLEDGAAKLAVNDSLRRMQAMSIIHQKLYQDQNTSVIAMPEYINDLVQYLHESFDVENKIVFEQDIEELSLDVSQAIPLGLIVTEGIVNALKYAFLNGQKGIVKIILQCADAGHLELKISDNGVGLPTGFDTMKHNSLGLDLMQGLAKQLNGELDIKTDNGAHITLKFKTVSD